MRTATPDEPGLAAIGDCLDEWNRCLRWERHHQREHDEWLRESPGGSARMLAIVDYWRDRRLVVESRLKELNERSRI